MNYKVISIIGLLAILELVGSVPLNVLVPTQDAFYTPPAGYEEYKNGDIIKIRKSPHKLRRQKQQINIQNAWQVMVRSSDSHGDASTVITTVIEPYNADPEKVVSYQIFENSACIDCAPSYGLQLGANDTTITELDEMYFIEIALKEGWFVVVPDYEGPKAAFTASRQGGMATLDSIRAALKTSNTTGINQHAKVAIWGYSGGTIPTTWAAALQPSYAPELKANIVGAAFGGLVSNITSTAELLEGGVHVGLSVAAVAGLASEYPDLKEVVYGDLLPNKTDQFNAVYGFCQEPEGPYYSEQSIFTGPDRYFRSGWDLLRDPIVKKILDENTLALDDTLGVPDIPLFLYHGKKDKTGAFSQVQRVYNNWCDWGVQSFEFAADASADHYINAAAGLGPAFLWLSKRLAGEAPIQGCSMTVRQSNISYPGISKPLLDFVVATVESWFGLKIGPSGLSPALGDTDQTAKVADLKDAAYQEKIRKLNW